MKIDVFLECHASILYCILVVFVCVFLLRHLIELTVDPLWSVHHFSGVKFLALLLFAFVDALQHVVHLLLEE